MTRKREMVRWLSLGLLLPTFLALSPPARTIMPLSVQGGARCSGATRMKMSVSNEMTRAESEERRKILFSMLAAATGSAALGPASAIEDEIPLSSLPTEPVWDKISDIMKPPLDDREYFAYRMANGLRVILASDPSTNEAGAAIDVHVGASSDPEDVKGLAHFNEHMLFLGTKDYPQEDSFEAFLAANGGSSNAFTASEDTVYYFTLQAESDRKLTEGLKRFGSFFTSPLFTESATSRELNAIESENSKNLQTDNFRVYQIEKSRQNSEHPHSKFFTGNKKTLLEDTQSAGLVLRDELIRFYTRYYSSNQMTAAIVGPQSISELRKMADAAFQNIPNRCVDKPEMLWKGVAPYGGQSAIPSFGSIVKVVPVQDLRQITISWPIIYKDGSFDRISALLTKQANYVAHLVGHEGPGSLLSYLKAKGWVNSLSASGGAELSDFESFEVTVGLTSAGLDAINKILGALFSYLSMLRDQAIPSYVYNEVLQLEELQWRFALKGEVSNYVQSLATSLQKYPPSLCVAGPRRLALSLNDKTLETSSMPRASFSADHLAYTQDLTQQFIGQLTVDNSLITVMSKRFEGKTDQKEKWYGTDFKVEPIRDVERQSWIQPPRPSSLGLDFPRRNKFIPSEAGLALKFVQDSGVKSRKKSFEERVNARIPPQVIRDDGPNGRWTVYYKSDRTFGQPKAFVILQLLTKEVSSSAKKTALAQLYEFSLSDKLSEYLYDAGLAGLTYDVQVVPRGVRLTLGGYNAKLKEFSAYITKKAVVDYKDILPQNQKEFERYKDILSRSFAAFDVKQPYAHCASYSQLLVNPRNFQYSNRDLRDATAAISLEDLKSYAASLWKSGKGLALVQGNIEEAEAKDLIETLDGIVGFEPIPESEYPVELAPLPLPQVPAGDMPTKLVVSEPNPENGNSASYVILQDLSEEPKAHVLMELIGAIVAEKFYEELRTRQQLGYICSSGIRGLGKSRYIGFIVQSSFATNEKLTNEIFKFLDTVKSDLLKPLPKGDFAVYVKSLIDRKTEPDKQLSAETSRNWGEIGSGRLQFDRAQQEVAVALELTKDDLIEFWDGLYVQDGRRMLVTEVVPRIGAASTFVPPRTTGYAEKHPDIPVLGIDDIEDYRKDREHLQHG